MKKRILSFILALVAVTGFIITPFSAFADNTAGTDYLLEEMQTNLPGFNPADYPKNEKGSPMIVGTTIYDVYHNYIPGSGYDSTLFSVYVYNPSGKDLSHCRGYFEVTGYDELGQAFHNDYNGQEQLFYKDDASLDGIFYKFTVSLVLKNEETLHYDLAFDLYYLVLEYKNGTDYKLSQTHKSKFEYDSGKYNVTVNSLGQKELDVNITSYKVGTVGTDLNKRWEIFTAYFSIPDQYIKYYNQLYSITSEYVKKRTVPLIWSSDSGIALKLYDTNLYWISTDYTYQDLGHFVLGGTNIGLPFASNRGFANNFNRGDVVGFYCESEELYLSYLYSYYSDLGLTQEDVNFLFFSGYENVINTKTIDETFDVLDYYDSATWKDYWYDYGAATGFARWALDNAALLGYIAGSVTSPVFGALGALNYNDVKDVISDFVDFDESRQHIEDSPYLVILSESDREFISTKSDAEISEKYLIALDDVSAFKQYINVNPYTVLYRFDICESYSDNLICVTPDLEEDGVINSALEKNKFIKASDYSYHISRRFMFFDFEVINVTFELEEEYVSVATRSSKKNYTPGLTVDPEPEGPPVDVDGGFDSIRDKINGGVEDTKDKVNNLLDKLGETAGNISSSLTEFFGSFGAGFLDGFFENLLGESWKIFKPILVVAGVALLIFLLWWILKSVTGMNFFDVIFQGGGLAVKAAEMKVKRSDSETRRRDAEVDARLRAEQNAIRKRELTIEEQDKKRRSDNDTRLASVKEREASTREKDADSRSRAVAINEREQARRHAKEDAAESEKEKAKKESEVAKYNNYSVYDALEAAFVRNGMSESEAKSIIDEQKKTSERNERNLRRDAELASLEKQVKKRKKD